MTDTLPAVEDGPAERSRRSWRDFVTNSGIDTRLLGMVVALAVIWICVRSSWSIRALVVPWACVLI